MATREEQIEQTIQKMQKKHPEQDVNAHREMLTKIFVEGEAPYKALGITKDFLEFVYAHAGNIFNSGKYDEAIQLYKLLQVYDGQDPRYSMALAACYHRKKEYQKAIDMYMVTYLIDKESFAPFYHMSDCFIQLNQPAAASVVLYKVLDLTANRTDIDPIRERVKLTIESLKPQLAAKEEAKKE